MLPAYVLKSRALHFLPPFSQVDLKNPPQKKGWTKLRERTEKKNRQTQQVCTNSTF